MAQHGTVEQLINFMEENNEQTQTKKRNIKLYQKS